jgi:hypothetical protein
VLTRRADTLDVAAIQLVRFGTLAVERSDNLLGTSSLLLVLSVSHGRCPSPIW